MKIHRIDENVLSILSNSRVDGQIVYLPDVRLERSEYTAVNKVLEAIGGTWNRKAQGHVFSDDPAERLDEVILTGEVVRPNDLEYFPTPPVLAERVIDLAGIEPGMTVLEPSAGTGALANPAADIVSQRRVYCCELNPEFVKTLLGHGYETHEGDFLQWRAGGDPFDRVVMNPPFSKQQDIDHVLRAWDLLGPGGRLVSIMSASVGFRTNRKTLEFRELVERHGSIERNPDGAFRESGTNVNTVTVVMDKAA